MPAPTSGLTQSLLATSTDIRAFAEERAEAVDGFIAALSLAVGNLQPAVINPEFPAGPAVPALDIPEPPEFDTPVWVAPAIPDAFTGDLDISDYEVEPFDISPPTLVFGEAPADFSGVMPTAPAVNLDFDDPTLTVTLPEPPTLLELSVGTFDGINLPTFDAEDPVLDVVAPTIREYEPGAAYTSALLTSLKATLLERLTTGGTGLDAATEAAIWERGREREARAYADAIAKLDQMEALGYALPPGNYTDARLRLITETDAAERGHSREVMIKSAEMQLDAVKHALSAAVELEGQSMNYSNQVEQRLFESARYATEAGVSIYNARVQAFAAMIDVYKSKVNIYEAQVRAEIAKVEAYKAEVDAEQAKAQINIALVDQYKAQIEAALSNVEIYKAEIAGIAAKADIEKTKVMIFGEQVRGYTAQIGAYTAGIEGYRAKLQAEETKSNVYRSQVEAFTARVNASSKQVEARIEVYKGQIAAKSAEYDGYRAAIQGESSRVEGLTKVQGVIADAYKAEVQAAGMYNEVLTKQWQAALDQAQRVTEIGITAAKANAELYISTRGLALDAAKTGAQVAAQIGAAAINAFNFSASVSSSEGYSANESVSNSTSTNHSDSSSTSTSTNYNYSV